MVFFILFVVGRSNISCLGGSDESGVLGHFLSNFMAILAYFGVILSGDSEGIHFHNQPQILSVK